MAGKSAAAPKVLSPLQLVAGLSRSTLEERVQAACAAESLAASGENGRSQLVAAGAIKPLVALLRTGCPDGKAKAWLEGRLRATGALMRLATTSANQATLMASGALPLLVGLLGNEAGGEGKEQVVIREYAAATLQNLAVSEQARKAIVAAGAVPLLMAMLGQGGSTSKVAACRALGALAHSPSIAADFINDGLLPFLVDLLKSDSVDGRFQAAYTLASLAGTNRHRTAVLHGGALPLLVGMLQDGTHEERAQAAEALAALCKVDDQVPTVAELAASEVPPPPDTQEIVDAGAIPPLVTLLSTGNAEGRAAAASALFYLSEISTAGLRHHAIILEAGALQPLVWLLANGVDARSRAMAAGSLRHLATTADREEIERAIPQGQRGRQELLKTMQFYCF